MEKWHVFLLIGVLMLGYAGYLEYFAPKVKLAVQDSPLNAISPATSVALNAGNFSAVQGLCTLEVTPSGGYLMNGTLVISTDDPGAEIKVYSALPVETLSGGTGNMTLLIPVTQDPVTLDILFTFTNTSIVHEVKFQLVAQGLNIVNATCYANPNP